jgi:hypothetical protein
VISRARSLPALLFIGAFLCGCADVAPRSATPESLRESRLREWVDALAAPALEGRLTGTPGEALAADRIARELEALGLEAAGDRGFLQAFEFTAGVSLGSQNRLAIRGTEEIDAQADRDWRPLAFSRTGDAPEAPIVFAGYGIVAPAADAQPGYDSYAGLDVRGRYVLVLRFLPEDVSPERRQQLAPFASLRHKAMLARDRGARGLLVASGPRSQVKEELVPLAHDPIAGASSLSAISISNALAGHLVAPAGRSLAQLEAGLASGSEMPGFEIPALSVEASVDLVMERRQGHNVIARLRGKSPAAGAPRASILLGAHYDHLGRGDGASLAKASERGQIHPGADDNASGVALLLDLATHFAERARRGEAPLARDLVFAAWSGEELGLLGSQAYAERLPDSPHALAHHGSAAARHSPGASTVADPELAAALNFDMVGRLRGPLVVHGIASSPAWPELVASAAERSALAVSPQPDSYLPTDSTSFYLRGVPILSLFTGLHDAYHSPRDRADTLDYAGMLRISDFAAELIDEIARSESDPPFTRAAAPQPQMPSGGMRASLGTIPDYAATSGPGAPLAGLQPGGPAERAGLRAGDRVVALAGRRIDNLYDYTFAIQALRVSEAVSIEVLRGRERVALTITPVSRE